MYNINQGIASVTSELQLVSFPDPQYGTH